MGKELKFVPGKGLLDGEEVIAEFDVKVLTIITLFLKRERERRKLMT